MAMQTIMQASKRPDTYHPHEQTDQPEILRMAGRTITVRRGREIYCEGSSADYFYRVITGAVRICKVMINGRRQITEFVVANDMFGFDGKREHLLSAEAITDVTLVRFPRRSVEELARHKSEIAEMMHAITLRRLTAAQMQMVLLGRKTAQERVASFLLDFAARTTVDKPAYVLDLPMSRYDVADHLGLTVETVSRALTAMRQAGLIAMDAAQHIRILDRERLSQTAELVQ
ncbi:MAG TPA: helix-turn-helix domain-containing protein [Rhodopila sp.]|nr:helix-turn-helix domain-containing protein [Rhodopila sp.]